MICHILPHLTVGGAEAHLVTLCKEQIILGQEIVIICLKQTIQDGTHDGAKVLLSDLEKLNVPIYDLNSDLLFNPLKLWRLLRLISKIKPKIIHTHLPKGDFLGWFVHVFFPEIPWIVSVHGLYNEVWRGKKFVRVWGWLIAHSSHVIAISNKVKTWLCNSLGLPEQQVTTIYYGIELSIFTQNQSALSAKSNLQNQIVIGSIGRVEPNKGYQYLIKAMKGVVREKPECSLEIAGNDPTGYSKELEALIQELSLEKHVKLVGFQSDVVAFLNRIDLFAFASISEGFGQVIIEAMAAEKAVIASDIEPLSEIIVNNQTGMLVEPQNPDAFSKSILMLINDPEKKNEFQKKAKIRVETTFTSKFMAEQTVNLYKCVIANGTN